MNLTSAGIQELVAGFLESGELPTIVQAGHPVLRSPALPFDGQLSSAELVALIELMRRTMYDAPGVGLAAPQIGLPLQLAVVEDLYEMPEAVAAQRQRSALEFRALINPRYEALGTESASFFEGCLSMRGWQAVVERPLRVRLQYDDVTGARQSEDFSGWPARIAQHETDHLCGTLYIDKALTRSLSDDVEYGRRWAGPGIALARQGLGF
ncbi:MAG: peptide deformylase [Actinomycetota bacterium]|uniref:peptide deformylase n=1 Tax=Micrococcaceae TaxID=1268 RepID=UPI0024BB4091|nr:peptide deformylase [Paenarthrobacter sp. PH39-S1]MDJ0358116.1 peptide deformylase [Paenarthrobacter sp. PH39-S1]MDQ6739712.1 peptide deformylase [Actinomycetota bacterium]